MGGDDRFGYHDEPHENDEPHEREEHDPPASVVFMEMMRRAAAGNEPPQAPAVDVDALQSQQPAQTRGESVEHAAADVHMDPMEVQRIRRVERRQARRRSRTVGAFGGLFRTMFVVLISAGLMATILSWWTNPQSLNQDLRANLSEARATTSAAGFSGNPTPVPTPNWLRRVGIVSGHLGPQNDPGAVCADGLTENEINLAVARLVVLDLRGRGYTVDLLEEFDERLGNYRAEAIVSIHANDCSDYGERVSGFLISQALSRPEGGEDTRLQECLAEHYKEASNLERRFGVTRDMTDYHIFRRIHATTPGVIIELGFMRADRELLTGRPDLLARGIVNGILCFLEPGYEDDGGQVVPTSEPASAEVRGS